MESVVDAEGLEWAQRSESKTTTVQSSERTTTAAIMVERFFGQ